MSLAHQHFENRRFKNKEELSESLMNAYEQKVRIETEIWKKKILKKPGMFNRFAKKTQTKINEKIPEKVHEIIASSIKNMIEAVLSGAYLISKKSDFLLSLEERERVIKEKLETYRKTAVVEGAGTGAGGILLGLADFPLLLSIKMKFLHDVAAIHNCPLNKREEKLFLLHVFLLAFSSYEKKKETLNKICHWEQLPIDKKEIDWQVVQQEYRDYIDLAKMLQLMPGIGAAVGAYANYKLLDTLGQTAIYAYRIKYFQRIS